MQTKDKIHQKIEDLHIVLNALELARADVFFQKTADELDKEIHYVSGMIKDLERRR